MEPDARTIPEWEGAQEEDGDGPDDALLGKSLLIVEGNEVWRRSLAAAAISEAKESGFVRTVLLSAEGGADAYGIEARVSSDELPSCRTDDVRASDVLSCDVPAEVAIELAMSSAEAAEGSDARFLRELEKAGAFLLRAVGEVSEEGTVVVVDDSAGMLLSDAGAVRWAARLLKRLEFADVKTVVLSEGAASSDGAALGGLAVGGPLLAAVGGFAPGRLSYGRRVAIGPCSEDAVEAYAEALFENYPRSKARFRRLSRSLDESGFVMVEDAFGHRLCSVLDEALPG